MGIFTGIWRGWAVPFTWVIAVAIPLGEVSYARAGITYDCARELQQYYQVTKDKCQVAECNGLHNRCTNCCVIRASNGIGDGDCIKKGCDQAWKACLRYAKVEKNTDEIVEGYCEVMGWAFCRALGIPIFSSMEENEVE